MKLLVVRDQRSGGSQFTREPCWHRGERSESCALTALICRGWADAARAATLLRSAHRNVRDPGDIRRRQLSPAVAPVAACGMRGGRGSTLGRSPKPKPKKSASCVWKIEGLNPNSPTPSTPWQHEDDMRGAFPGRAVGVVSAVDAYTSLACACEGVASRRGILWLQDAHKN